MQIVFNDLGLMSYKPAWDLQETWHSALIEAKLRGQQGQQHFILCEHPHVYTLGKSGAEANMLINDEFLKQINAEYHRTNRGGDITYHGPGQIVGYPIMDLEQLNMSVKTYVNLLEEIIIRTLGAYSIKSSRLSGATGVWLDADQPGKARKICAIGVKVSRAVTLHGFALNVNTDLKYFQYINPCGFVDKGVTSLSNELGHKQDLDEVKAKLRQFAEDLLGVTFLG